MDDTLKILSQHSRLSGASIFEGRLADLARRLSHSPRVGPGPGGAPTDPTRPTGEDGSIPVDPSTPDVGGKVPPCFVPGLGDHPLNDKYLFLRDIGGVSCLRPFLKELVAANDERNYKHRHWGCTLVIDQEVTLHSTLTLPAHFTLAGVGPNGAGTLRFVNLQPGEPAIVLQQKTAQGLAGFTTIQDLGIEGVGSSESPGLWLEEPSKGDLWLHSIRVQGFLTGIVGQMTRNVSLANCAIENNGTNIYLTDCTGWRLRDCNLISATSGWGLSARSGVSDLIIEGCRIRENLQGGIEVGGAASGDEVFGVVIMSNIIGNNTSGVGIRVHPGSLSTRILHNALYDNNEIEPKVETPESLGDTQIALNASDVLSDDLLRVLI